MSGLIFESRNGKPYAALQKVLRQASEVAGIKITSHVFRHASATYLYESTGDLYKVQAHLRHKNIATTQIYAKMSIQRRRDAVTTISDYLDQHR